MPFPLVTSLKFVGTISLGLLTGTSAALSTLTLPSLLTLPSAPAASSTLTHLNTTVSRTVHVLSSTAISSFALAYLLSPKYAKHPYLLWVSGSVLVGVAGDWWYYVKGQDEKLRSREVNGEKVRERVERWRAREAVRVGWAGLGWGLSLIGLWGDRFF